MSQGTSTEIQICGATVRLGDRLKVRYTRGREMKGCTIEGEVVELWSREKDNHLQGRLSCGWCFHDHDEILSLTVTDEVRGIPSPSPSDCSTIFDGVGYAANLQRAIEYHCHGKAIPDALAKHCPYHAHMLNDHLSNKTLCANESE